MKKLKTKKIIAGIVSTAMLYTTISGIVPETMQKTVDAADSDILFSTGFEDGEGLDKFSKRGDTDTSVLSVSDEVSYSGSSSMCVSERSESWNGPQFKLDDEYEAGVEYLVSAYVKTEWYSTINLSMQYTDEAGDPHYSNIKSVQGDGWAAFEDIKVSFTSDMKDVYIYFEAGDANTKIYVDDFTFKKAPVIPIEQDIPSLSNVYSPYFKIGTAICASNLSSPSYMDLVEKHFSKSMTFGNELKPESVLNKNACLEYVEETGDDTNPQVTLSAARGLLNYCRDNNIPVRGHTLVWHSQTPDWFFKENYADDGDWVSKDKMIERMENYIKNVMEIIEKEYPTVNFYAWDVVNEAWMEDGKPRAAGAYSKGDGSSAWVQIFGDNSFIEYAFQFARKYAPEGCKLYYNDYNEYMDQKMNAIYNMALELKEKGLIDGIGMQAHLDVGFPTAQMFEAAVAKYASTGLDVQITELDITTSDTSEAGLKKQAQLYSDVMDAAVKYADSVSAVVIWGVTDDTSWRADRIPLIFDDQFKAKPAFYSMIDGLDIPDEPDTTTPTVTTPPTDAPQPVENLYGDLNGDKVADLTDLTLLSLYLLGDNDLSEDILKYADVNGNGTVDIADLAHFKQYVSKESGIVLGPQ